MTAPAAVLPARFDPGRLRAARHAAGFTLRAVVAHTGQNITTVQRYERGVIDPPTSALATLAALYGVHPGDLFT